MLYLTKRYEFRAAHHLEPGTQPCDRAHGHNYFVEVTVEGPYEITKLDDLVERCVTSRCDRQDLNQILPKTAGESLVIAIYGWLFENLNQQLVQVSLQETPKNRFMIKRHGLQHREKCQQ
jgi:6-pyruvoyl-tetrahydropterin synthase